MDTQPLSQVRNPVRGVDWQVVKTRNLSKVNGVRVSQLTDENTSKFSVFLFIINR
jgi:hypothetical protein